MRSMSNYFSVGADARIGLGFDKRRTKTACCNKCCYAWEGLKKLCCTRTRRIKEVIDHMATIDEEGNSKILFASTRATMADRYLEGDPVSLVATNINSYMGGRVNLWESGSAKPLGLIDGVGTPITYEEMQIAEMSGHDDGKLEFHIFSSTISMSLGKSNRLA